MDERAGEASDDGRCEAHRCDAAAAVCHWNSFNVAGRYFASSSSGCLDLQEYIENANENELVELYNAVSDNEAVYNEESSNILVKTPETTEIIADAEKAEAPEEEVVAEKEKADDKDDDKDEEDDDTAGEVPMLDKEFDDDDEMGEDVELEKPSEDKFTNDLDPQK